MLPGDGAPSRGADFTQKTYWLTIYLNFIIIIYYMYNFSILVKQSGWALNQSSVL